MELQSRRITAQDYEGAMELCVTNGWTDGLPVAIPTPERVQAMLSAAGQEPAEQLAFIENRQVTVTAEKAAINAVMAGCRSDYMPVVVAAVKALADPLFGYHGPATSTGGAAIFMLINGPIAQRLDVNHENNLFGPGWRANATIGRAIRLIMRNVIGTVPGELDRACMGHAGKYTFCIAENEAESPWQPFHTTRGFEPHQNAVTIFAAVAPHQFINRLSRTPEGVLNTACSHMRLSSGVGRAGRQTQYALVLAGEHMSIIGKAGWSREDVQAYCFEHTRTSLADLKGLDVTGGEIRPGDENEMKPLVETPQDFLVIAAGGRAGVQGAFIPGWGSKSASEAVTKEIL